MPDVLTYGIIENITSERRQPTLAIKLIALDLDDTLLNSNFEISERNAAAIHHAQAAGIIVMIATGRMFNSAKKFADFLDLDLPMVTYNGALVKGSRSQKIYAEQPIKLATALELLAYCKERGYYIQAYQGEQLLVKENNAFSRRYTEISGIPATPVGEELYHIKKAPYKLLMMTRPEEFDRTWKDVEKNFAGKVDVTSSKDNFLELMEPGVNKWHAVQAVAQLYRIRPEEIMCIGDSNNDLVMIKNAGLGVAMGNAKDRVRQAAKLVTASNNEDGVALAIETVLQAKQ